MAASDFHDHALDALVPLDDGVNGRADVELVNQAHKALEAVRLVELGARAVLVRQLTGLDKKVVNRLYHQRRGRPSPPGQTPFSDMWYRQNNRRLLHANVVWRLFQRLTQSERSPARVLIDVYESYLNLVQAPVLDVTHAAFVSRLVAMKVWQERTCEHCHLLYVAPTSSRSSACPACSQYFRYRCRQCGAAMDVHPKGRRRIVCAGCTDTRKRTIDRRPH